jgi:hypothetical protein
MPGTPACQAPRRASAGRGAWQPCHAAAGQQRAPRPPSCPRPHLVGDDVPQPVAGQDEQLVAVAQLLFPHVWGGDDLRAGVVCAGTWCPRTQGACGGRAGGRAGGLGAAATAGHEESRHSESAAPVKLQLSCSFTGRADLLWRDCLCPAWLTGSCWRMPLAPVTGTRAAHASGSQAAGLRRRQGGARTSHSRSASAGGRQRPGTRRALRPPATCPPTPPRRPRTLSAAALLEGWACGLSSAQQLRRAGSHSSEQGAGGGGTHQVRAAQGHEGTRPER